MCCGLVCCSTYRGHYFDAVVFKSMLWGSHMQNVRLQCNMCMYMRVQLSHANTALSLYCIISGETALPRNRPSILILRKGHVLNFSQHRQSSYFSRVDQHILAPVPCPSSHRASRAAGLVLDKVKSQRAERFGFSFGPKYAQLITVSLYTLAHLLAHHWLRRLGAFSSRHNYAYLT